MTRSTVVLILIISNTDQKYYYNNYSSAQNPWGWTTTDPNVTLGLKLDKLKVLLMISYLFYSNILIVRVIYSLES